MKITQKLNFNNLEKFKFVFFVFNITFFIIYA